MQGGNPATPLTTLDMILELSFAGHPLTIKVDPISGRLLPLSDASTDALHPDLVPFAGEFAANYLLARRTEAFLYRLWQTLGFNDHGPIDLTVTRERMSELKVTRVDIERCISQMTATTPSTTINPDEVRFQSIGFNPVTGALPIHLRG